MGPRRTALLVLLAVVLVFVLQNTDKVEIEFLFWQAALSEAIVLLGTLGIGLLAGWLLGSFRKKQ